jgi:mannan endo-1,4-beta-mannosidase
MTVAPTPERPTPSRPAGGASLSRRGVLAGLAGAGLAAAGVTATSTSPAAAATAPLSTAGGRPTEFVSARHGQFTVGGRPWRFGGTNNYYLHDQSHFMIDSVLQDAASMSLRVIRAWSFIDGPAQNGRSLQPEPYVYNSADFDSLDYAIHKAGTLGLRLVLPLVNNWPDYGGMQQYVTWLLGLPDDTYGAGVNHDRFYTEPSIRAAYRAWAEYLTHRRNPYTGLRYNEDPTIMTFELANEPRCRTDKSGRTLLTWAREMSDWVSQQAPRQLVAIGDEGFFGTAGAADYPYSDYEGVLSEALTALPAVDYGTCHLYPQGWGENRQNKPGTDPVTWGVQWIRDHATAARKLGKPVVLEEYGLAIDPSRGVADVAARDTGYTSWTHEVETSGFGGDQFWLLTGKQDDGTLYPDYDGYRVVTPSSTAALLAAHARRMATAAR